MVLRHILGCQAIAGCVVFRLSSVGIKSFSMALCIHPFSAVLEAARAAVGATSAHRSHPVSLTSRTSVFICTCLA